MKSLLLLLAMHLSSQTMSDKQRKFCTENDNGDVYKYDLTPLGNVKAPFKIADSNWMYNIALCGEMNLDLGEGTKGDAIVQTGQGEIHIVGTEITNRYGGEMWVNLVLGEGEAYHNHCNKSKRKAQILFICDPTVGIGVPQILDEANADQDYCFYMFEWSTSLVCPANAAKRKDGMSAAKLLLLEVVVIILVYGVLGVGYKRFVLGARGTEQIPNLAFWKQCGEAMQETVNKCKGGSNSSIGGVRSNDIGPRTSGTILNINAEDDDDRLIM